MLTTTLVPPAPERLTPTRPADWYSAWGKRSLDIVCGSIAAILLLPVIVITSIILAIAFRGQVFFRQRRPGKDGRVFEMIKFQTMTNARDRDGNLLPDAERLTGLGKFLRASSIDELPELWNVLRGDMSLVGPRPLLIQYLGRYSPTQFRRHETRPGVTGWAQVNGRNALTWNEKFAYDLWYVDNYRLALDLYILFKTIWNVVARSGISAKGHATMPEFQGNGEDDCKRE